MLQYSLCLVAIYLISANVAALDGWRFPNGDSKNTGVLDKSFKVAPQYTSVININAAQAYQNFASPVIAKNGTAYFMKKQECEIYVVHTNPDGTSYGAANNPFKPVENSTICGSSLLLSKDDMTLYYYDATINHALVAIDAYTMVTKWLFFATDSKLGDSTTNIVNTDIDNNLYFGVGNKIYKVSPAGNKIWEYNTLDNRAHLDPTSKVSPSYGMPLIYQNTLYYLRTDGYIFNVDLETMDVNWIYNASVHGDPTGVDFRLNAMSVDDYGKAYYFAPSSKKLFSVKADGDLDWVKSVNLVIAYGIVPVVHNGLIYLVNSNSNGQLMIYNSTTGDYVDGTPLGYYDPQVPIRVDPVNNRIYSTSLPTTAPYDPFLFVTESITNTWQTTYQYPIPNITSWIKGNMGIGRDGRIYLMSQEGTTQNIVVLGCNPNWALDAATGSCIECVNGMLEDVGNIQCVPPPPVPQEPPVTVPTEPQTPPTEPIPPIDVPAAIECVTSTVSCSDALAACKASAVPVSNICDICWAENIQCLVNISASCFDESVKNTCKAQCPAHTALCGSGFIVTVNFIVIISIIFLNFIIM